MRQNDSKSKTYNDAMIYIRRVKIKLKNGR